MLPTTGPAAAVDSIAAFGETNGDLIRLELLHELFEQEADLRPEQSAGVCGHESLTYGQLERAANQLAWRLRSIGIGPGALVGLLLPRSLDAYVGMLGILKSGAAYVPIDPECPAERVAYILADSRAQALVTHSDMAAQREAFAGAVIELNGERQSLHELPAERISTADRAAAWRELCYVIYTSGTTGKPKGVEIEHRSACHLVRAEGRLFQVQPDDRVFQGFSLAFDASVEEVWLAWFAGAT